MSSPFKVIPIFHQVLLSCSKAQSQANVENLFDIIFWDGYEEGEDDMFPGPQSADDVQNLAYRAIAEHWDQFIAK